jgi:hypothetical protein
MHAAAHNYVKRIAREHGLTTPGTAVELGAFDVNGSARGVFAKDTVWTGVDVRAGRGVDVVADGAEWQPEEPVGLVLCTEVLEHCPHWRKVLTNAAKMLAPGGALIVTAAGPGRTPHGCDGGDVGDEHYEHISPAQLTAHLKRVFPRGTVRVEENAEAGDVYALAIAAQMKAGAK